MKLLKLEKILKVKYFELYQLYRKLKGVILVSGIIISGHSDDIISIDGEISEEFYSFDCENGKIMCSDGTLLNVEYDNDGIWRFNIVSKGFLFDKKIDGDVHEDLNDEIYFKSGIKWIGFTNDKCNVVVSKNKSGNKEKLMKNFEFEYQGNKYWYSRSMAIAVFLKAKYNDELYILANKRGQGAPDYKGYWNCPCGYLDFNEKLEQCAIREVFEETGVTLKETDLKLIYVESDPLESNKQNVTCRYIGTIDYCELNSDNSEKGEVEEVKWIKISDIDNYEWAFNHNELIKKYFNKDIEFTNGDGI